MTFAGGAGTAPGYRWAVLGALFVARVSMGFQFQSLPSIGPLLVSDLGIGYAELGTLIGLYMLPGVAVAIPGGMLAARFGDKRTCCFGLALMAAGSLAMSLGGGFGLLAAGRIAAGVGAVVFNLVLTKMVTDWFGERERATAMGIALASWPCGLALGLVTQVGLAAAFGWPAVMVAAAGFCFCSFLLAAVVCRDAPIAAGVRADGRVRLRMPVAEATAVLAAGLLWGVFNVGFVCFFSFAPAFLAATGASLGEAASVASLALWISMVSLPVGSHMAARSGRPDLWLVMFSLASAAAMALLTAGLHPVAASLVFGVVLGPPCGPIMALPGRALAPERRAVGFGIFYIMYYLAMAAGPAFAGALRDATGSALAPLLFAAATFAVSPLLLLVFQRAQRAAIMKKTS